MARGSGTAVENNFIQGRISEATGLNFPENAVVDESNCEFTNTGKVERRKGIDVESGASYAVIGNSQDAYTEYVWKAARGLGESTIVVTQIGPILHFYESVQNSPLSSNKLPTTIDLSTYGIAANIRVSNCQFTGGFGHLFVTNPWCKPLYIVYNSDKTLSAFPIDIFTRDVGGLDLPTFDRNTTITPENIYQLMNQGWPLTFINSFFSALGVYPSSFDVWWLMKDQNEVFDPATYSNKILRGNSPAPKGSFALNEFNQDRSSASGVGGIPIVTSNGAYPSTVEIFAGRVWYAGVAHPLFSNKIYFTRVVTVSTDYGLASQMNDPTSEYSSDLLASDGGVISIPDCGNIQKVWSIENALLVFATNGIWQISGSSGIGFAANDFVVKKISSLSINNHTSFVDVGGFPAWWQEDGISIVTVNSQLASTSVASLTDETLKTFYQNLPITSRQYAKGEYDPIKKIIYWLYRSTPASTVLERSLYDSVLCFNIQTKAFWTWSISNTVLSPVGVVYADYNKLKFHVKRLDTGETTFANQTTGYKDWESIPSASTSYSSYFISGYKVHGDANKKFQSNYLNIYAETSVENLGSFYFQSVWDYAINTDTGKYSGQQLLTYDNSHYRYRSKRIKIRGHGKALQFKVFSVGDEPFSIIGWSGWETVNSHV